MSDPRADAVARMRAEAIARLRAAGVDNPRLDVRLLWEHARQQTPHAQNLPLPLREGAIGSSGARADWGRGDSIDPNDDLFATLIARRAAREPLAYITGHKEFWSLDFAVGSGVLIPRPDTETLIEELVRSFPDRSVPLSILDLGTGSGCLLIAALKEYPKARGTGIDASPDALAWARRNAEALRVADRTTLVEGGWPDDGMFDVILSNPPYIPSGDIAGLEPEVAGHEPRLALDGGRDGLDAYRALAPRIARLLRPGGRAFLEVGIGQSNDVAAIMGAAGLETATIAADLAGIPRCIVVKTQASPI